MNEQIWAPAVDIRSAHHGTAAMAAGSACDWVAEVIGGHFAGLLKGREHRRVELHLSECVDCSAAALSHRASHELASIAC